MTRDSPDRLELLGGGGGPTEPGGRVRIARILEDHRIVSHPIAFRILARLRQDDASIEAGEYRFAAHRTSDEVLRELVAGSPEIAVWVTIPEGFTMREIAQTLADAADVDEEMRALFGAFGS